MKKITLLIFLLSNQVFATESALEKIQKNLSNPELYTQHHISLFKEEPHHFLFIPYTKEILVSDIHLSGADSMASTEIETPYVSSITQEDNKNPVINHDILKTGISINISTVNDGHEQTITFQSSQLNSLTNFSVGDLNIQLPNVNETFFTHPILSNSFEKVWTDTNGTQYKLKYSGEKNSLKI